MKPVSPPDPVERPPDPGGESRLEFSLRPEQEAQEPPEARGLRRDEVRLMVTSDKGGQIRHTRFTELPRFLQPDDLLVVNTSGTMNAALRVTTPAGNPLELHLSTRLPADLWLVELRQPEAHYTLPYYYARAGDELRLPGGGRATLLTPYRMEQRRPENDGRVRIWVASVEIPRPTGEYLDRYGFPIRYKYVRQEWPLEYYQTVFAQERGSAEMPSAGRAFSHALVKEVEAKGVEIRPILLHTGVASLENNEMPYEEYYRVPPETARAVNQARQRGSRVIAVGTTVVRALETGADEAGVVRCGEGYTGLVVTPARGIRTVTGLLTGFHEPRSSHLMMLEALAGMEHLRKAYTTALEVGYLWHEFGDLHLILP